MVFDEIGSGGLGAAGIGTVVVLHPSVTAFGIGDIAFNIQKARRGVLEKVVVKEVRTVASRRTGGVRKTLYVDTLNGLWNEYDLVPCGKATALAEAYYANLVDAAGKLSSC